MDSIAPNIFVKDMNETIKFYQHLGFTITMSNPEEGDYVWAMMTCGNVNFMFQTFESLGSEIPAISCLEEWRFSIVLYPNKRN